VKTRQITLGAIDRVRSTQNKKEMGALSMAIGVAMLAIQPYSPLTDFLRLVNQQPAGHKKRGHLKLLMR